MGPIRVYEALNDVLKGFPALLHMVLEPACTEALQLGSQPKPSEIAVELGLCLNVCPTGTSKAHQEGLSRTMSCLRPTLCRSAVPLR